MTEPLEPLEPALREFLDDERQVPPVPNGVAERLRRALDELGEPPPRPPGAASPSGPPAGPLASWGAASIAAGSTAVFLVGLVTGVVLAPRIAPATRSEPPARAAEARAPRDRAVRASTPGADAGPRADASEEGDEAPALEPATGDPPPMAAPVRRRAPSPEPPRLELGAERRLLDVARAALVRGHPDEALAAVERHARRYPHGQLVEERESLRIQAHARAGNAERAAELARAFRARFPESLFGPAIEHVLR